MNIVLYDEVKDRYYCMCQESIRIYYTCVYYAIIMDSLCVQYYNCMGCTYIGCAFTVIFSNLTQYLSVSFVILSKSCFVIWVIMSSKASLATCCVMVAGEEVCFCIQSICLVCLHKKIRRWLSSLHVNNIFIFMLCSTSWLFSEWLKADLEIGTLYKCIRVLVTIIFFCILSYRKDNTSLLYKYMYVCVPSIVHDLGYSLQQ